MTRANAYEPGIGADPLPTEVTDQPPSTWVVASPCDCLTAEEHLSRCFLQGTDLPRHQAA